MCHRIFYSAQTASGAEQGADLPESLIRRPVHNGDELVARQEFREFLVSDPLRREAGQQRRGDQHDPGTRLRQAFVDCPEQRRAKHDVLLTEPNRHIVGQEQVAQLLGRTETVIPSAAEEDVAKVRVGLRYERTADTLEKQTALLESAATHREEWTLEPLTDASIDQRWKAMNKTGYNVTHVSIGTPDGFNEQWILPGEEAVVDVPRGGSIFFSFVRRLSSPTSRTIWVLWTPADGSAQQKFVTTVS